MATTAPNRQAPRIGMRSSKSRRARRATSPPGKAPLQATRRSCSPTSATRRSCDVRRGIYRLVHFPASDHEDLVVLWLWSEQAGVFSHETALALHDLSDALPGKVHMTLPRELAPASSPGPSRARAPLRRHRRRRPRQLFGACPSRRRSGPSRDCIEANVASDLVRQGILQARRRGLVSAKDEARLVAELGGQRRAVAAR